MWCRARNKATRVAPRAQAVLGGPTVTVYDWRTAQAECRAVGRPTSLRPPNPKSSRELLFRPPSAVLVPPGLVEWEMTVSLTPVMASPAH